RGCCRRHLPKGSQLLSSSPFDPSGLWDAALANHLAAQDDGPGPSPRFPMRIACPSCQTHLRPRPDAAGEVVRCPSSGRARRLPDPRDVVLDAHVMSDEPRAPAPPPWPTLRPDGGAAAVGTAAVVFGALGLGLVFVPCLWPVAPFFGLAGVF